MEGSKKPHLIAYRKESFNKVFKVDKKLQNKEQNKKSEDNSLQSKPKEPDRRRCDCNGNDHQIFSNCMGCGRLICVLEKEGPCMECNTYVYPVDSENMPKEHLDNPEYKIAVMLRNKLVCCDKEYQSEDFKVHDLQGGWFEESRDVYNENSDLAQLEWLKEEAEKRVEQEVLKYDLDLVTGRLSVSNKDQH